MEGKAQLPRSGSRMEKYQPDWRMLFGPASCTVSAFGIGEDGSLEMEVASESIISVVDEEECNQVYIVTLLADGAILVHDDDKLNIFKAASQKMELEVAAKNIELKGLRSRK